MALGCKAVCQPLQQWSRLNKVIGVTLICCECVFKRQENLFPEDTEGKKEREQAATEGRHSCLSGKGRRPEAGRSSTASQGGNSPLCTLALSPVSAVSSHISATLAVCGPLLVAPDTSVVPLQLLQKQAWVCQGPCPESCQLLESLTQFSACTCRPPQSSVPWNAGRH